MFSLPFSRRSKLVNTFEFRHASEFKLIYIYGIFFPRKTYLFCSKTNHQPNTVLIHLQTEMQAYCLRIFVKKKNNNEMFNACFLVTDFIDFIFVIQWKQFIEYSCNVVLSAVYWLCIYTLRHQVYQPMRCGPHGSKLLLATTTTENNNRFDRKYWRT